MNASPPSERRPGLTQEQLGELVGVSRQAVSKWESGQAVPDALTITALCQKLHVSADYLLLGVDPDTASGSAASAYTPPGYLPLLRTPCWWNHLPGMWLCPAHRTAQRAEIRHLFRRHHQ